MSRIVVTNHLTLDGVMQSPASPDEDTRDGFDRGGWAAPKDDEVMGEVPRRGHEQGRVAAAWPPHLRALLRLLAPSRPTTRSPRCSTTRRSTSPRRPLSEPLPWENSTLLEGEVVEAVAKLKRESDRDTVVLGSGELLQTADAPRV